MDKLGKDGSRRLRTPAFQAWVAVCRIAHKRQIVWYRYRRDAEFGDHAGLIAGDPLPAIQLHDTSAAHALGEILVRRADDHAFDTRISSGRDRRGS
jgi:hypothetical protein